MHIKIKRGLDIPIEGAAGGPVKELPFPRNVALDVTPFETVKFHLFARPGERVEIGQPLLTDKVHPDIQFVSPAGGVVQEIRRGLKRRLLSVVIQCDEEERFRQLPSIDPDLASREELVHWLAQNGLLVHLRMRPFGLVPRPNQLPRSIFVKALESAPFVPPAELQVKGFEDEFQCGLDLLAKLTEGRVHLVYGKESNCPAFTQAKRVVTHTAEGPHPIANSSVHIHYIDPIRDQKAVIWTASVHDVVCLGVGLLHRRYHPERVVSIAGTGVVPGKREFVRVRTGYPIEGLIADRCDTESVRLISGDPLTGVSTDVEEFLGFRHFTLTVLPEARKREFLHFIRLGFRKFSALRAYFSGHRRLHRHNYAFTTSMHGEERSFIDGTIYDRVMPMRVPTMLLVKAVIAEDFDQAEQLGLLEVDPEDFALPTFICPSKVEMCSIIKQGLQKFAHELLQ